MGAYFNALTLILVFIVQLINWTVFFNYELLVLALVIVTHLLQLGQFLFIQHLKNLSCFFINFFLSHVFWNQVIIQLGRLSF